MYYKFTYKVTLLECYYIIQTECLIIFEISAHTIAGNIRESSKYQIKTKLAFENKRKIPEIANMSKLYRIKQNFRFIFIIRKTQKIQTIHYALLQLYLIFKTMKNH